MQAIQAGSTLLVFWIDRHTGGCEDPADGMSGGSTDTESFVWCSDAVVDGWSNLPDSELEKSSQDTVVIVASSQLCMTFLCLLLACRDALLCVCWWLSKNHALVLAPSSS